jgi:hypothetical protein
MKKFVPKIGIGWADFFENTSVERAKDVMLQRGSSVTLARVGGIFFRIRANIIAKTLMSSDPDDLKISAFYPDETLLDLNTITITDCKSIDDIHRLLADK